MELQLVKKPIVDIYNYYYCHWLHVKRACHILMALLHVFQSIFIFFPVTSNTLAFFVFHNTNYHPVISLLHSLLPPSFLKGRGVAEAECSVRRCRQSENMKLCGRFLGLSHMHVDVSSWTSCLLDCANMSLGHFFQLVSPPTGGSKVTWLACLWDVGQEVDVCLCVSMSAVRRNTLFWTYVSLCYFISSNTEHVTHNMLAFGLYWTIFHLSSFSPCAHVKLGSAVIIWSPLFTVYVVSLKNYPTTFR